MAKRLDYNQIAPKAPKLLAEPTAIVESGRPTELVELVYRRVSQSNKCAYWFDMHTREFTKTGSPIEKLALVRAKDEGGGPVADTERAP
jgi:AhpD family alkylhydroperoxidase